MSYLELLILAICLCFDTFAVSVCGGVVLCNKKICALQIAKILLFFSFFQAGFLFTGWLIGSVFAKTIANWDHWIAFFILLYIGGKMIIEFFQKEKHCDEKAVDLLKTKNLIILSIATSIDAVAVGVSLALIYISVYKIAFIIAITIFFTAFASFLGLKFGTALGKKTGKNASLVGGIILIIIGIKILIEHV